MLKNYLKIAIRNLMKDKIFMTINITGLSIGIACSLLIFLFIQHEYGHERFHDKSDRIFRVVRCFEKENGIRKVLGATVTQIMSSLSAGFLGLFLIANVIAWPIAWYATNSWLQNFAYRIDLTIWPFLLAGLAALVIALLTVSWQVIRAAMANPVEALRYE